MGLQRVGHDWATFTFTSLSNNCASNIEAKVLTAKVFDHFLKSESRDSLEIKRSWEAYLIVKDGVFHKSPVLTCLLRWIENSRKFEKSRKLWNQIKKIPWRRKWQPTPLFLPGESHGRRSLVGYSPRVAKGWTQLSNFILFIYFYRAFLVAQQ